MAGETHCSQHSHFGTALNTIRDDIKEIKADVKEGNKKFATLNESLLLIKTEADKKIDLQGRVVLGTREQGYKNGLIKKFDAQKETFGDHLEYHKKRKLKPKHWILIGAVLCVLAAAGFVYLPDLTRAILKMAKVPLP